MASSNQITVQVPQGQRGCCGGAPTLVVTAAKVQNVLEELERQYPDLHRSLCDETGRLRRHINLFVNSSHMRERQGLETVLEAGDVITILPAVSGG